MAYPIDLVLIRHGESEGNVAQAASKVGDNSLWTDEFKARHTSRYRLTDRGREQARIAGAYVKEHIGAQFDRYYCSEFTRAKETAGLLGLDHAEWLLEFYLRERDKGVFNGHSWAERQKEFKDEMRFRESDAFYWCPPGGESVANACLRVDRVLDQLKQSCSGFRVLAVCHGNIMSGFRVRIERWTQEQYYAWDEATEVDPKAKIQNGGILWYTRRDPETGKVEPHFTWMKSICPWDEERSDDRWIRFRRSTVTSEELLEQVRETPQIVNNSGLVESSAHDD